MRLSLTKQTEYALRALVWLVQHDGPEVPRHKAARIAGGTGMPPVFATRVLAQLQRQGLLNARAGQQGGYVLARPPERITLLEVIEAVEGPLLTQTCVLREAGCGAGNTYCVLHDAWSAAQAALRARLAQTTLSSAIDDTGHDTGPNVLETLVSPAFGQSKFGPVVPTIQS